MGTTLPLPKKGAEPPPQKKKIGPCLLWPNGWMNQDGTWHGGRPQPRRLCVRCGLRPPSQKGGRAAEPPPQFSAHFYCGQTAGWIKTALGMEVGLSQANCVRWGPSPLPQKGAEPHPQFSAHFYCGQTAGCIKIPLGMEVASSQGTLC